MRKLLLFTLFTMSTCTLFAQKNEPMEIYTFQQHKIDNTDPEKNKTTILVSGTQGDEVLNVKLVTSKKGILELYLNDAFVDNDKIADYDKLTACITDYAEMPRQKVAEKDIPKEEPPKEVDYKDDVNGAIIAELKKDKLITEETKVFDIVIAYDKMYFNGQKQSDEMSKRYKELYESISGKTLKPTTYYHMSQTL